MQTSCKENKTVLVHYFSLVTLASGCARFMQLQKSCLNKSDWATYLHAGFRALFDPKNKTLSTLVRR